MRGTETVCIVIPTYRRPNYLAKLLTYLSRQGVSYQIVVSDSSPSPEGEINQGIIERLQNQLDLRYLRFDPKIPIVSKITEALKAADADYSLVCADDDFVIPAAIQRSADFLESNQDYATTSGRYVSVYAAEVKRPHQVVWRKADASTPRSKLWAIRQETPTIGYADPSIRLSQGAFSEVRAFYAVHRRQNHVRNMELASQVSDDWFFAEHLLMCLSLIQGKLASLDTLYMVRRYESHDDYSGADPWARPFHELIVSSDFSQKYLRFRDCLGYELSKGSGISFENASKLVDQAFLRYLAQYLGHYLASPSIDRSYFHGVERLIKMLLMGLAAGRSALLDRRFRDLLASPLEFAIMTYVLREHSQPLDAFVRRYSSYRGFMPMDVFLSDDAPHDF